MKIGKYRIIKEEEYQDLKRTLKFWNEREAIIKDNSIQKEKEELEKKYKKYFGKFYESDEGVIFQIDGIYYDKYNYGWNKFKFSTSAPNNPDWSWEIDIDEIVDEDEDGEVNTNKKYDEVKNPKF